MAYLMHIGFSNDKRLKRNIYYFEYKGVCFKLIQNIPRRWADVLLSILPSHDPDAEQKVFKLGAELSIDVGVDIRRMKLSSRVLEEFAKYYIKNELKLDKKCYLVRERKKEFPRFVTESMYKQMHFEIAYP